MKSRSSSERLPFAPAPGASPEIILHIDGASRGNPGPAAYGVTVEDASGKPVAALSKFIGRSTNNVAEYHGLLAALEYSLENHHRRVLILTDSELLARQMQGLYKVKSPDLKPLFARAQGLAAQFDHVSIRHVPREQNAAADGLANQALDAAAARVESKPATTSAKNPAR